MNLRVEQERYKVNSRKQLNHFLIGLDWEFIQLSFDYLTDLFINVFIRFHALQHSTATDITAVCCWSLHFSLNRM